MKPIIGISSFVEYDGDEYSVSMANAHALLQAGGMPVMLPHLEKKSDIDEMAQFLDGLYLTGGYDIDPTLLEKNRIRSWG
ncbi:gamma-glutamyl-gamma-aminobutyrate hydrolase family protein [Leptospira santarosai]|nr:gamma-glutamyl-gamma-aminobutyrate hydrolase family protein [Leptospira santarosai]